MKPWKVVAVWLYPDGENSRVEEDTLGECETHAEAVKLVLSLKDNPGAWDRTGCLLK